jgi:hypothetical protein
MADIGEPLKRWRVIPLKHPINEPEPTIPNPETKPIKNPVPAKEPEHVE